MTLCPFVFLFIRKRGVFVGTAAALKSVTMNTLNLFDTFDRAFNLNMNTIMNSRYKESDFNRLKEGDTEYSISLNLAGTNKSDIKVSFEKDEDMLSIKTDGETPYYYRVYIPNGVDADKSEAKYENGILSIIIPKTEKLKPVSITVD